MSHPRLVSFAIQHHPSRADLLYRSAELNPEVVTDPEPTNAIRNPWRTYRTALERTPLDATHRVVIQDDAELCSDFRVSVEQAVASRPDNILCLFVPTTLRLGSRSLIEACTRDEPFCLLDHREWVPVVALAWPVHIIPPFLNWCDRKGFSIRKHRADDAIVGDFCRENQHWVYATVPSLVEHPDDVDSIIGTKTGVPRSATCFAGENAHLIEWERS